VLNRWAPPARAASNYITGPTYLLNRVRREAMAFTEMILRLGRTPGRRLERYTL
jgi:hypothetical protein